MVERNIIMGKAGGTAGKNSVNYKISLPAEMVKALGVTQEDKAVSVDYVQGNFFNQIHHTTTLKIICTNLKQKSGITAAPCRGRFFQSQFYHPFLPLSPPS